MKKSTIYLALVMLMLAIYSNLSFAQTDLGVGILINPMPTSSNLGEDTIIVNIYNASSSDFTTGFTIEYQVDNNSPISESGADTIQAYDSISFKFMNTYNFDHYGTYKIHFNITNGGGVVVDNDTMTFYIEKRDPIILFEDFETTTNIGTTGQWSLGAPNGTVINQALSGGGVAMTGLNSSYSATAGDYLTIKQSVDLSNITNPILSFYYWSQADTSAHTWLEVVPNNGDGGEFVDPIELDSYLYPQTYYNRGINGLYGQWHKATFSLSTYQGTSIDSFNIVFEAQQAPSGSLDGIAIDNLMVYDAGDGPELELVRGYTGGGNVEMGDKYHDLKFDIFNYGNSDANGCSIFVSVDNKPTVEYQYNMNIYTGFNRDITFDASIDLSEYGEHHIKAWVKTPGDMVAFNDTIEFTVINLRGVPIKDSLSLTFDDEVMNCFSNPNDGYLFSSWERGIPQNSNFAKDNNVWKTGLATGGSGNREISYLALPGMSFAGTKLPTIEFDIRCDLGQEQAVLLLYFDENKGNYVSISVPELGYKPLAPGHKDLLDNVWFDGDKSIAWTDTTYSGWQHIKITVPELADQMQTQLQFLYVSRDNWEPKEGVAIDNFKVYDLNPQTDLEALDIISPNVGKLVSNETVTFVVHNNGKTDITSFKVNVISGIDTLINNESVSQTILPDSIAEITLSNTLNLSAGFYEDFRIEVITTGDEIPMNNTSMKFIVKLKDVTVPTDSNWFDNFETNDSTWITESNPDQFWEWGLPSGDVIDTSYSGTKCWVTSLDTVPIQGNFELISPLLDFSNLRLPKLSFYKWCDIDGGYGDGASLFYTNDMGRTWVNVTKGDENWYNDTYVDVDPDMPVKGGWSGHDTTWNRVSAYLPKLAGDSNVVFKIKFSNMNGASGEGFAIDDFKVEEASGDTNVAITNLFAPKQVCSGSPIDITVSVKNIGTVNVGNFQVYLTIDGTIEDTITQVDEINNGSTQDITFTNVNISTGDDNWYSDAHSLTVYTVLQNDAYLGNDTTYFEINLFNSDFMDQPGWQSLNTCDGYPTSIYDMAIDANNNTWIAAGEEGIVKVSDENMSWFGQPGLKYTSIATAKNGDVWWANENTPEIIKYSGGNIQTFMPPVPDMNFGKCIYAAQNGDIWFGGDNGNLLKYSSQEGWIHYPNIAQEGAKILAIGEVADGGIMVSALIPDMYDEGETKTDMSYPKLYKYNGVYFEEMDEYNQINSIYYNEQTQQTWFGGSYTLYFYDATTDALSPSLIDSIGSGEVMGISKDIYENMWFLTYSGEFTQAVMYNGTSTIYTPGEGLLDAPLSSVCGLPDGKVAFGSFNSGVSVFSNGPSADFDYFVMGDTLQVYDMSVGEGIISYRYSFGDGAIVENVLDTMHIYNIAGNYEVCLTISDTAERSSVVCREVAIGGDTSQVMCKADFGYDIINDTVYFINYSSDNANNYYWDFADGDFSEEREPTHYYANGGYFEVWLTVNDTTSGCYDKHSQVIEIISDTADISCHADFGYSNSGKDVTFYNSSLGDITDYLWDFGDGEFSSDSTPIHSYNEGGMYSVCLTVYNSETECMDEACMEIAVEDTGFVVCMADFSYTVSDNKVSFASETSSNISDIFWDFNDGEYSNEENPVHYYTTPGFYKVELSAYDSISGCIANKIKTVVVKTGAETMCNAQFSFFVDSLGNASFTNTSIGGNDGVFWDFGDGTYAYDDFSPTHKYTSPGFYNVTLSIYDDSTHCMDEYSDVVPVTSTEAPMCQASFDYFINGKDVTFNGSVRGNATDYFWDFGDGYYAFDKDTVHTYGAPGFYEVVFTTYDAETNCLDEYWDIVKVIDTTIAMCNADFTYYPDGMTASFTSQATGDFKQLFWDFDDGTNSNNANPVHTFAEPGYYNVSLTVIDTTTECFDTRFKVIYIEPEVSQTYGEVKADYSHYPDSLTVYFNDDAMGNITDWYWDFGDNTPASADSSPVHTYSVNDFYRVCQTVENPESQDTKCKFIAVGDVSGKNTAFFTYYADSVTATAYFQNKSLGDISDYYWSFGDGVYSSEKNPTHTYADTGYYAVCLTTTSTEGRQRTYCNDVRIGNAIENPCLFSCVWPGDANNDLEANHYDILTIGLNYGMEGPKRENATTQWYGQYAQNWSTYQQDSVNNKHGDTNGDGVINDDDTLAVHQNFAFSHYWQPDVKATEWEIQCIWDTVETKRVGDKDIATIVLFPPKKGEKAGDLYGIGYEIKVIGSGFDWDAIGVQFNGTWLSQSPNDMISFYKIDKTRHSIFISEVRKDHNNISGQGKIANLYFTFRDGFNTSNVSFIVTTKGGIKNTGDAVGVDGSVTLNMADTIGLCGGDPATLTAPDGFKTYKWSTGATTQSITVTTEGKYTVTVTNDAGDSDSDTITVITAPYPDVDLAEELQGGSSVVIDAGSGFNTYLWNTGATTQSITATTSGIYSVTVTNNYLCADSDSVNVIITSIDDVVADINNITVYPNPNKGSFWLITDATMSGNFRYELLDVNGKVITNKEVTINGKEKLFVNPEIHQGVYILKMYYNNKVSIKKVIVQ